MSGRQRPGAEVKSSSMKRRDVIKLAGTVAALGAVLGFDPGQSEGGTALSFTYTLKFYSEDKLLYTLRLPSGIVDEITHGNKITIKFHKENELITRNIPFVFYD